MILTMCSEGIALFIVTQNFIRLPFNNLGFSFKIVVAL